MKLKSIDDVEVTARASSKLRVNKIRLGDVNFWGEAHDEIFGTIFQEKN